MLQQPGLLRALRGLAMSAQWAPRRFIKTRIAEKAERDAQELLDGLYHEVRALRFEDIVVLQTRFNSDPRYMILASAFNQRHLTNGTDLLNRRYKLEFKKEDQHFANISIAEEWNVIDFHAVVVHLLSRQCRAHFDIEQLWAVGEKYDDHINFPGKKSSTSSTDISGIPTGPTQRTGRNITLDAMSIPETLSRLGSSSN